MKFTFLFLDVPRGEDPPVKEMFLNSNSFSASLSLSDYTEKPIQIPKSSIPKSVKTFQWSGRFLRQT